MGMGAGTAFEVMAPVCAGDIVEGTTYVKDVFTKTGRSGTMTFVLLETILTDQSGERVVAITESFVRKKWRRPDELLISSRWPLVTSALTILWWE